VRVLGTRFDVEARERDLQLLVVEGVVEVRDEVSARARVEAGELYTVMDGRELPAASVPDALPLMGWAGNFMAFQSTPLADAVLEIERQYGVRIEILDPVLATRMITAWFTDRPLEEVLRVVCLAVAAQCKSVDGVILMNEQTGGAREPSLRREISDKEELIP
jgi:ferric-dicitrate binding protein FerR (iron transport regulator)